jgi:hypothetical protein
VAVIRVLACRGRGRGGGLGRSPPRSTPGKGTAEVRCKSERTIEPLGEYALDFRRLFGNKCIFLARTEEIRPEMAQVPRDFSCGTPAKPPATGVITRPFWPSS